jgi:hypothetical protein
MTSHIERLIGTLDDLIHAFMRHYLIRHTDAHRDFYGDPVCNQGLVLNRQTDTLGQLQRAIGEAVAWAC